MNEPMDDPPRIAAIFATMNRAAASLACLKALSAQTRPPDLVVVADNVSKDGTADALEGAGGSPFELVVHRMAENRGNAGGVEEAMELAFRRGADFVWILDDDSIPRPDALRALVSTEVAPSVVRHAIQIDPATGRLTWPMWMGGEKGWRLVDRPEEIPEREWVASRASWTGALISREVREAVGPVNGELFIRGEDEEYPWRISEAGFSFAAVPGAALDHPGAAGMIRWKFFSKNLFFERGLADWKLYYKIRNMVWLKRRQSGAVAAIAIAIAYAIAVSRVDGIRRLPLVREAARDGWRKKLGKWSRHPA